jgi:hypothetical protein
MLLCQKGQEVLVQDDGRATIRCQINPWHPEILKYYSSDCSFQFHVLSSQKWNNAQLPKGSLVLMMMNTADNLCMCLCTVP